MSKNKTRHILAARHVTADTPAVLVANLETKKYCWANNVQKALDVLEGRNGAYDGSTLIPSVLGWLKGEYPEAFVKVVIG